MSSTLSTFTGLSACHFSTIIKRIPYTIRAKATVIALYIQPSISLPVAFSSILSPTIPISAAGMLATATLNQSDQVPFCPLELP